MSIAFGTTAPLLPVYARADVTFIRGEGSWLLDGAGNRYLDLVAGIAVVGLGHSSAASRSAAIEQLDRLWHASNLYWTEPMQELAERLSARFGGAQAFFCNSGAEAVEAALKYARRATGKSGMVALEGSFHGRTLGALSVTGQTPKRVPFEPLLPHVRFVPRNDIGALADAVGQETGCILLEPIQGEGGVHELSAEYLGVAREIADTSGALLVFDEVQTGVGRTGSYFAFEHAGIRPDAVTLAKALANGLPIGCLLVAEHAAGAFAVGDHASTFGGNPVACAAACAVDAELTGALLAAVCAKGERVRRRLPGVRGRGLLLALDVAEPASDVVARALAKRLLVCTAGDRTIRLTPPLTIKMSELELGLDLLEEVLDEQ
jgi:acetylornithine/N-succinyldiaminopimelate aminotransferase